MVQFNTPARNAGADGVVSTLDVGAGAAATIELVASGDIVLATFGSTEGVQDPAFGNAGTPTDGQADLANVPMTDTSADASGTVVAAVFSNQDANERFRIGVGAGRPISMTPSTTISAGDEVTITAVGVVWPAGTP